jgi:2-haloalkanoic acid dehalogenase type II
MMHDLQSFRVLSFDIYATLIDWETGIYNALEPLLMQLPASDPRHPSMTNIIESRKFILGAYNKYERVIQSQHPTIFYCDVLAEVHRKLAHELSIPSSEQEAQAFGQTVGSWPAYPDTVSAMHYLSKYYKLIALSNVDNASFSRTLAGPLASVTFDAIYTAELVGSYKPDLRNFQYLIDYSKKEFGNEKHEILHVAWGLYHDHTAAKKIGMHPGIFISRAGNDGGMIVDKSDMESNGLIELMASFTTLGDFAEAVKLAFGERANCINDSAGSTNGAIAERLGLVDGVQDSSFLRLISQGPLVLGGEKILSSRDAQYHIP